MLGWLFKRTLDRDEAIAAATAFLETDGCRVVTGKYDKCDCGPPRGVSLDDRVTYLLLSAELPGKRWYVKFRRVLPPGWWFSHQNLELWVHSETGVVEFPN